MKAGKRNARAWRDAHGAEFKGRPATHGGRRLIYAGQVVAGADAEDAEDEFGRNGKRKRVSRQLAQDGAASRPYRDRVGIDPRKDLATAAMDIQLGGNVARPPATLTSAEVPKDIQRAQKVAWNHYEGNFVVRAIVDGKIRFFDYGRRLMVKGKPPSKKILNSWQRLWQEYENQCNGALMGTVQDGIDDYIGSVWRDTLVYDTVVSFLRTAPVDPGGYHYPLPFTIQPFRCYYTSAHGYPRLKVELDWDKKDLPSESNNYRYGQVAIQVGQRKNAEGKVEGEFEHYKILTRGPFGYGFGRPGMASIFRALGQCVSMEAGESLVGYLARSPIREHTIGHETRYGPYAGGTQNFITKKRADATMKFWKSITGLAENVKNFDQKTSYLWIGSDPKWFSSEKWRTIIDRVVWWAQSFGFMYVTRSINPYLFPIFQQEAEGQRKAVGAHIAATLGKALDTDDLTVEWSSDCFTDQRLAFEMTKALMTQGPLSLETALRRCGFNPEREFDNKMEEKEKDPEGLLPLYDASHGVYPGKGGGVGEAPVRGARAGGRPALQPPGTPTAGRPPTQE